MTNQTQAQKRPSPFFIGTMAFLMVSLAVVITVGAWAVFG
jgi:hypothetical protein